MAAERRQLGYLSEKDHTQTKFQTIKEHKLMCRNAEASWKDFSLTRYTTLKKKKMGSKNEFRMLWEAGKEECDWMVQHIAKPTEQESV